MQIRKKDVSPGLSNEVIFIAGKDPCRQEGGHGSYVRAHARAAVRIGFEPHIFYVGRKNALTESEFGILHSVASWPPPFRPVLLPLHAPRLVRALTTFLERRTGPHLLHTFGFWHGVGLKVAANLAKRNVKCITLTNAYSTLKHEYDAKLKGAMGGVSSSMKFEQSLEYAMMLYLRRTREAKQLMNSDLVLVNYDSVSRLISEEYGNGIECRKIPYCSEVAFIDNPGENRPLGDLGYFAAPEAPLIVAVSRHDPRKGLDYLLRALAGLRSHGIPFRACLVGGGMLLEPHRRYASRLGLDDWVRMTGRVEKPFAYLQQADIFVLPSIEEGSGSLALLEALQAGVPIIASRIDGIPEDVAESEALLVDPQSVGALEDALATLLADAPLRARMGEAARARYETSFSAEALTTHLRDIYAEFGFHCDNG